MATASGYGNASGAMAISGAVTSMISAYYGGAATRENLRFQADMAAINARMAEQSAQSALLQGQRQEQASRLQTAHLKSAQRTAFAANGIDLTEGSPQRVFNSTDYLGEVDANTIAANASRSAWGYRTQTVNYMNDANARRSTASALSPSMAAASSLMTSAGSVADKWYTMNKTGVIEQGRLDRANGSEDPLGAYGAEKGWW